MFPPVGIEPGPLIVSFPPVGIEPGPLIVSDSKSNTILSTLT